VVREVPLLVARHRARLVPVDGHPL